MINVVNELNDLFLQFKLKTFDIISAKVIMWFCVSVLG